MSLKRDFIRSLRALRGLRQVELARSVGRGLLEPRSPQIAALARQLGVETADLVEDEAAQKEATDD